MRRTDSGHLPAAAGALLLVAGLLAGSPVGAQPLPCDGVGDRPCGFGVRQQAMADVPTTFRYQARLTQAKLPVGDRVFGRVVVRVKRGHQVLCLEELPEVRVRNSTLDLEIGRAISCDLDRVLAENHGLVLQVCLGGTDNCLRPAELATVPYALKASHAVQAQRALRADVAGQAHWVQRVSADRDLLLHRQLGTGYFDFATPPAAPRILSEDGFLRYEHGGFLQWTPLREVDPTLHVTARDPVADTPIPLYELRIAAERTETTGRLDVLAGGVHVKGASDVTGDTTIRGQLKVERPADGGPEGRRVFGDSSVDGLLTVSDATTVGSDGLHVTGGATVAGDVQVVGQLRVDPPEGAFGWAADVTGDSAVAGALRLDSGLKVTSGGAHLAGDSTLSGALRVSESVTAGDVTVHGTLRVLGDVEVPNFDIEALLGPVGDVDGDWVANATDNCLFTPNADQRDADDDGRGDGCDPDWDNDLVANDEDCAPEDARMSWCPEAELLGWWPFDGDAQDHSGNGHHGTLEGGPVWSDEAHAGQSLQLDAEDDYVDLGEIDLGDQSTLAAWVYRTGDTGTLQVILTTSAPGVVTDGLRFFANNWQTDNGKLILESGDGAAGAEAVSDSAAVPTGRWVHVAVVVDRSEGSAILYADGVRLDGTQGVSTGFTTAQNVRLGAFGSGWDSLLGHLDDVRIYGGLLTDQEIGYLAGRCTLGYERCDGQDNDCDGEVDEDHGQGDCRYVQRHLFSDPESGEHVWVAPYTGPFRFIACGAPGGAGLGHVGHCDDDCRAEPGKGALVWADYELTAGDEGHYRVGGVGEESCVGGGCTSAGGYNGGGGGGDYGGGGGGATDARIVAGGGGGGVGGNCHGHAHGHGGDGGGASGEDSTALCAANGHHTPAGGGTQEAGGTAGGGDWGWASAGARGQGGGGGGDGHAAGGGGGYYGGGGGYAVGGGGGSSWTGGPQHIEGIGVMVPGHCSANGWFEVHALPVAP